MCACVGAKENNCTDAENVGDAPGNHLSHVPRSSHWVTDDKHWAKSTQADTSQVISTLGRWNLSNKTRVCVIFVLNRQMPRDEQHHAVAHECRASKHYAATLGLHRREKHRRHRRIPSPQASRASSVSQYERWMWKRVSATQ